MREIENNLNNLNFKGVQLPTPVEHAEETAPVVTPAPISEDKEIKDLKNMPELGRSQVAADSIETDMKILDKKPELVEQLNKVIDEYEKTHTQEETIKFMDTAIQEFFAKK